MVEVGSLIGMTTRVFATHFEYVISVAPYKAGYDDADYNSVDQVRLDVASALWTIRFFDDPKVSRAEQSTPTKS